MAGRMGGRLTAMARKALVIGSEGNIGGPLVRYLHQSRYDVLETDMRPRWRPDYLMADINHPLDLLPAFDWGPDTVFMLSAVVSRVSCEQASSLAIATNLGGIDNVLQLCRRVDAMTVFFSTSEVYGPGCDPMDEAKLHLRPNNRYGLSKLLGEQLVEYEVRTNGLRAVSLRPFMVYDDEEEFGEHRSAMIRFAYGLATDQPIEMHRGGSPELASRLRRGPGHRSGGARPRVRGDQQRPLRGDPHRGARRENRPRAERAA